MQILKKWSNLSPQVLQTTTETKLHSKTRNEFNSSLLSTRKTYAKLELDSARAGCVCVFLRRARARLINNRKLISANVYSISNRLRDTQKCISRHDLLLCKIPIRFFPLLLSQSLCFCALHFNPKLRAAAADEQMERRDDIVLRCIRCFGPWGLQRIES